MLFRSLRDGIAEYVKRLSAYTSVQWIEVADERTPDGASHAEEERIRRTEGERLIKRLPSDAFVIALAIEGKEMDSVSLSRRMADWMSGGKSHFVFVIGGSLGLSDEVMRRADLSLSFSKMTFPHQIMRLLLLEQLYRSFRILNNAPYHK